MLPKKKKIQTAAGNALSQPIFGCGVLLSGKLYFANSWMTSVNQGRNKKNNMDLFICITNTL
jgi:hypothetical protein